MSNAHFGIVYDVSEVIGREAVGFDQDNIILDLGASGKIAHHDVVPFAGFGVGFEAEREAGMPGGGIFGAEVTIEEGLTGGLALVTIGLDLVG